VWLDVHPEQTEEEAPQRGAYSEAEVILRLKMEDTVQESRETVVENIVAQVRACNSVACQLEKQLTAVQGRLRAAVQRFSSTHAAHMG
jgi:hypothetical protein